MTPQQQHSFQLWAQNIERAAAGANATARKAMDGYSQALADVDALKQVVQNQDQRFQHMQGLMQGLRISGSQGGGDPSPAQVGRPDMLSIEEIPGRRIPYDLTIQIGIPDSQQSPLTGSYPLSMDGPFVAVARYATFISSYTFQVTSEQNNIILTGRTWGRQRMISSVLDLMDAMPGWVDGLTSELDGTCDGEIVSPPAPAVTSRPASRSPFRSMTFDGYIEISSSTFPRQNQHVPTSLWAPGFNQMVQLPVLDYWEKGETIEFKVEPSHVNNPTAGNIQGLLGSMPYLAGQYDGQEGIMYPAWQCTPGQADIIQRRPSGILVVGLLGYKILQPPGVRLR